MRKACGRARQVVVYCHSGHSAELWWEKSRDKLDRFDNLTVINLSADAAQALAKLAGRSMQLQCTIQESQIWLADANDSVTIEPVAWKRTEI